MALGKKLFEWSAKDMINGVSSSDDIADGGFSSLTDSVNLIATPGVAFSPTQPTDKSTSLTGLMIASCENANTAATADRFFLAADASNNDGTYYYWDGSSLALKRTDSTGNYAQGKSDIAAYKSEVYATSDIYVVRWVPDTTFNATFFDFTGGYSAAASVPHPILNYIDYIYYGNGNLLLRQTTAGGAPSVIMTLSNEQVIVTLAIDPGSGKMLISTTNGFNISDTLSQINKVHYYDGFSAQPLKTVVVDDMVTAFPFTEGQLYAAYGTRLGLWNGAGITFLRKCNVGFDNTELLYKHHFTNSGSTLYFIEKTKIMAHGEVHDNGEKIFYPAFKNQVDSTNLTHIANVGQGIISIGFGSDTVPLPAKFYTWSTTSVSSSNTQDLFSNSYQFDDEMWIRRIRVIFKNQVSNGVTPGSIRLYDADGLITTLGTSGLLTLRNTSGASSVKKDILNVNARLTQVQFEMLLDTINPGIRRIIFYGDPANIT